MDGEQPFPHAIASRKCCRSLERIQTCRRTDPAGSKASEGAYCSKASEGAYYSVGPPPLVTAQPLQAHVAI